MRTNRKTLAAGIGSAGLLGLGLYLAVPAASADPSPPAATATPHGDKGRPDRGGPHRGHPHRWGRPFRGVHGEATVRREDGFHLATWQHGKITAVSGASLTVQSEDGASWTWTTNDKTRIRKDAEQAELKSLTNGDEVLVAGERSGTTRTARLVRVPKAR